MIIREYLILDQVKEHYLPIGLFLPFTRKTDKKMRINLPNGSFG